MELRYLHVGRYKGDWDFGVSAVVATLDYEEMKELRAMTIVAIGTMEDMWRRTQERKNPASQVSNPKEVK